MANVPIESLVCVGSPVVNNGVSVYFVYTPLNTERLLFVSVIASLPPFVLTDTGDTFIACMVSICASILVAAISASLRLVRAPLAAAAHAALKIRGVIAPSFRAVHASAMLRQSEMSAIDCANVMPSNSHGSRANALQ